MNNHDTKFCRFNTKKPGKPQDKHKVLMAATGTNTDPSWIIDSGASKHLCGSLEFMTKVKPIQPFKIYTANGQFVTATHQGVSTLTMGNNQDRIDIQDVYYVPKLKYNLLSINELSKTYNIQFQNNSCIIRDKKDQCIATASSTEGVYKVPIFALNANKEQSKPKKLATNDLYDGSSSITWTYQYQ